MPHIVFLAIETTGLIRDGSDDADRIIELALVEMVDGELTGRCISRYINPERASHPDALMIHGVPDEYLSDCPKFGDVADEVLEFLWGADRVVFINTDFALPFLKNEIDRLEPDLKSRLSTLFDAEDQNGLQLVDVHEIAKARWPGERNSLDTLCERADVTGDPATSGAWHDVMLLARVWQRLGLSDPAG